MKHTSGPWHVDGGKQESLTIRAGGQAVAVIPGYGTGSRLADARLIAAAPSLLEALEQIMYYAWCDHGSSSRPHFDHVYAYARAAIDKATGENQ